MGREFTNALASIPLWSYALKVYPTHKDRLLHWQDTHAASVNDLIALAFAYEHGCRLPDAWWGKPKLKDNRQLIVRARAIRRQCSPEAYQHAKDLELNLEGVEIQLLGSLFENGDVTENIAAYASFLKVDDREFRDFIVNDLVLNQL
jgi:hypothetical protein